MKKFLGIVCILYSLLILYVWYFDKIKLFLAPQMAIYLKAAFIPLLIIGIVLIVTKDNTYKFKFFDIFLLLPLIMFILSSNAMLSSNFAKNRMNSFETENKIEESKKEENQNEKVSNETLNINENYDFSNPDLEMIDKNYNDIANYITFMPDKAIKYIGKTIKVKGFATTNSPMFSSDYFVIGKYSISCCAADASYTGFIVERKDFDIKQDNWYEIEGVLVEGENINGSKIVAINPVNIKEIDSKGEEQYVYPCYSYDNGECADVKKYNLEY